MLAGLTSCLPSRRICREAILARSDSPSTEDLVRYGSAVITAMSKGDGEVFCAGTTEWCHALAQGDTQVETITRNVLDHFLD